MVGPNPHNLHSFCKLREIMGRPYLVCRPCRRFAPLGAWLDGRGTRTTAFSCSVCGAGAVVLDDPAKEGMQHDPRPNPPRHQLAVLRLQQFHQLTNHYGRRPPPRESVRPREKPRRELDLLYRLKPFPFTTFGELPRLDLVLEVWCAECKTTRPVEINERLAACRWGRVRFTCSSLRSDGTVCGGFGHPQLRPAVAIALSEPSVTLSCTTCMPPWQALDVQLDRPPWSTTPIDTGTERYRCPACRRKVTATFHYHKQPAGSIAGHLLAPSAGEVAELELASR